jgi:hypothetical protein
MKIFTPEIFFCRGFYTLFDCLDFFITFPTQKGYTDYAETKSPTETTSKAFSSTDTGYQAVGAAGLTAGATYQKRA